MTTHTAGVYALAILFSPFLAATVVAFLCRAGDRWADIAAGRGRR